MAWILIQPDDDEESNKSAKKLVATGECDFDVEKNVSRLWPVSYVLSSCTNMEKKFHSFVGESAAGRWGISQNRHYLLGTHLYWMCECKAVQ